MSRFGGFRTREETTSSDDVSPIVLSSSMFTTSVTGVTSASESTASVIQVTSSSTLSSEPSSSTTDNPASEDPTFMTTELTISFPTSSANSNNNNSGNFSATENRKNSTGVIVGGIIGGLALIVLIGLLGFWTKKHRRPHKDLASFKGWKGTRTERKDNERPIPYDLKHVSLHVDQNIPRLREPNSTLIPTTELCPDEKSTFLSGRQFQNSENSSFIVDSSLPANSNESNTNNTSDATRTRSRAFSESSLTRVPSTISQSTLTVRQLDIRGEADELRTQLSARYPTGSTSPSEPE